VGAEGDLAQRREKQYDLRRRSFLYRGYTVICEQSLDSWSTLEGRGVNSGDPTISEETKQSDRGNPRAARAPHMLT